MILKFKKNICSPHVNVETKVENNPTKQWLEQGNKHFLDDNGVLVPILNHVKMFKSKTYITNHNIIMNKGRYFMQIIS